MIYPSVDQIIFIQDLLENIHVIINDAWDMEPMWDIPSKIITYTMSFNIYFKSFDEYDYISESYVHASLFFQEQFKILHLILSFYVALRCNTEVEHWSWALRLSIEM